MLFPAMPFVDYQTPPTNRQSAGTLALWFAYLSLATAAFGWLSLIGPFPMAEVGMSPIGEKVILACPVLALAGVATGFFNLINGIGPKRRGVASIAVSTISFVAFAGEVIYFLSILRFC